MPEALCSASIGASSAHGPPCCAQQTGMHILVVEALLRLSIYLRCSERLKYTMPVQAVAGR
jgi:hypothetical protein